MERVSIVVVSVILGNLSVQAQHCKRNAHIILLYLSIYLSIHPSTYPSVEDKKDYEFLVQGTKNKKDKTLFVKHSMQL